MTDVNLRVNLKMNKKEVLFYKKPDGECPVETFLDSLPAKAAQRVIWVVRLIEDLERVPSNYFCKMTGTDGLWEFRIKLGSNIFRVFAFFDGAKVILTNGFIKKSQKTPHQEIERAENFKKDYFQRVRGGE